MKNFVKFKLLGASILVAACLPFAAYAADGLPGATVSPEGKAPTADERKAHMEYCKANPDKCRAEGIARREQWCKDNPQRCKEIQERREKRLAECKANPEKCQAERKARREQMCKENPARCKEMNERREQGRADKKARFEEHFKRADANGNGAISRAEAQKILPRVARHFERFDANGDGQVTHDEIAAVRKASFERRRRAAPEAGRISST